MDKITVELCMGTTCFVMGGSGLEDFVNLLSPEERCRVEIVPSPCIGLCKDREFGKAPYARINGEVVPEATVRLLAEKVRNCIG